MEIKEVNLTDKVLKQLISLSEDWEAENSCYGYRKNSKEFIEKNCIFLAMEDNVIIGYLLGHMEAAKETTSIYQANEKCFEIEELYVKPQYRSHGIGKRLFQYVEKKIADEADIILLSTATKNFRAILHFYIEELGMEFWSARLFKKVGKELADVYVLLQRLFDNYEINAVL